jgi:biotin operon repressor
MSEPFPRLVTSDAAQPPASADVIVMPKQLRMEWTDHLALDTELSHVAFRVGCVIGRHFNSKSGETFVKQETIARVMKVSARTVWNAVKELEDRGHLIIRRRELGKRATDGRRVCGGRGVANTYLPAFERSQLAATNSGKKLAARCDLLWEERSQKPSSKVAADCDPTLSYFPSESNNPSRARARAAHTLGEAGVRLCSMLGDEVVAAWFSRVKVEVVADQSVTLSAPTRFIRNYIAHNYSDALVECFHVARVEIVVRK